MREDIIEFIHGFSESLYHQLRKEEIHGKEITEDVENKIFRIVISIVIISTGIFVTILGFAFYVDERFATKGFGYVLIGIVAILTGLLIKKR